jgi:PEP-CTERM motif
VVEFSDRWRLDSHVLRQLKIRLAKLLKHNPMKKILLISACLALAHVAFSQGTIAFNNRTGSSTTAAPGQVTAPVYGVNPADPSRRISGNTSAGVPVGSTSYGSSPFAFNDANHTYIATLWGLSSSVGVTGDLYNNNLLAATANGSTSMRANTSGTFAGIWTAPSNPAVIPGVTTASDLPFLQVRVWDTKGGTINTWTEALNAWNAGQIALGVSDIFQSAFPLGGTAVPPNTQPNMQGLQSFNLTTVVPEPSTIALGILGAGCLFLLRRRK